MSVYRLYNIQYLLQTLVVMIPTSCVWVSGLSIAVNTLSGLSNNSSWEKSTTWHTSWLLHKGNKHHQAGCEPIVVRLLFLFALHTAVYNSWMHSVGLTNHSTHQAIFLEVYFDSFSHQKCECYHLSASCLFRK